MSASIALAGCLPGDEGDVANKYNKINQDTQVENIGMSLMQAANAYSAHEVALHTMRKAPLDPKANITTVGTMSNSVRPELPRGMTLNPCGEFGAVTYFNSIPAGVSDMQAVGPIMVSALSKRFGGQYVGIRSKRGNDMPLIIQEIGCANVVGNDIVVGSPIVVSGFAYGSDTLPDARKATWPSVTRDITIPCPTNLDGVIKREQHCQLISNDDDKKVEKGKIKVGGGQKVDAPGSGSMNDMTRLDRIWRCTPDISSGTLPPPTADEITSFCRDTNAGLQKQADNTINMSTESLKKILETGSGVYDFKCRVTGSNVSTCNTAPYNPPLSVSQNTILRCDNQTVPEQYVINPIIPLQKDGNGRIISATPAATKTGPILGNGSCGQGWTGDLIAGYQIRACRLMRVTNGVETLMSTAEKIYKIGYVGARCSAPPKEAPYRCPRPFGGEVILRENNYMTKPMALQLGTPPAVGEWSPSTIPWRIGGMFGNANAETIARAAQEDYRIMPTPLQGVQNPRFSSLLEGGMRPYMTKEITGCKLAGQTCEWPPDPMQVGIVFDRSQSMDPASHPGLTNNNPPLSSASNRMACQALLDDIFTDKAAACDILRNNALDRNTTEGRPVEAILGEYLVDRQDPVLNNMMFNAVQNQTLCGDVTVDKIGTCTPGGSALQSSCSPGRCVGTGGVNNGTYIQVADDQLKTALGHIPSGSEIWYTEYNTPINGGTDGDTAPTITDTLCNVMTDTNCDFAASLDRVRTKITVNTGQTNSPGTPLMKATAQALAQFDRDKTQPGVLLYFTDGSETDGVENRGFPSNYGYPYGSFCDSKTPPSDINNSSPGAFCRGLGLHEGVSSTDTEVLAKLKMYYTTSDCSDPLKGSSTVCVNILRFYNPTNDELVNLPGGGGKEWTSCLSVSNRSYPSAIEYIKNNYPNLKVFILDLSNSQLGGCFNQQQPGRIELIDAKKATGYAEAFERAFPKSARKANPEEICTRIRAGNYPNAVSY